jgi:hypothetical protein
VITSENERISQDKIQREEESSTRLEAMKSEHEEEMIKLVKTNE